VAGANKSNSAKSKKRKAQMADKARSDAQRKKARFTRTER
jgi:hypothetical protein